MFGNDLCSTTPISLLFRGQFGGQCWEMELSTFGPFVSTTVPSWSETGNWKSMSHSKLWIIIASYWCRTSFICFVGFFGLIFSGCVISFSPFCLFIGSFSIFWRLTNAFSRVLSVFEINKMMCKEPKSQRSISYQFLFLPVFILGLILFFFVIVFRFLPLF